MPRLLLAATFWAVFGCAQQPPPAARHLSSETEAVLPAAALLDSNPCGEALRRVESTPVLPGAAELERQRVQILMRVKSEPVIFTRAPRDDSANATVRALRAQIARTRYPWDVVHRALAHLTSAPELARAVLLSEGYLYADNPALAFALVDQVRAEHLFGDERIWIERGERVHSARRERSHYVWEEGPERERRVRLLLFDRIGTGERPTPLHRDVRALRYRVHFDELRVRRHGESAMVADLRYGDLWVPTVLAARGAHLELECEVADPGDAQRLAAARERGMRRARVVQLLRGVMLEQIDEGLPFDEPITEMGQQDGRLRSCWRAAYFAGKTSFRFDVDRYPIFDDGGRPLPPQVCMDFLTDTLERASGTWWRPRGDARARDIGRLDFQAWGPDALRPARSFIEFAERHPEWFEVHAPPLRERVPFGRVSELARYLAARADVYVPGDMVIIFGWTPWDDREQHFHSFFVYESDPVTGFPMAIAGNAGRPTLRTWARESQRTPRRTIERRIRPRLEWLEGVVDPQRLPAEEPPPLAYGPT